MVLPFMRRAAFTGLFAGQVKSAVLKQSEMNGR